MGSKKHRNKSAKPKPKVQRLVEEQKNIVAMQPTPPLGAYTTEEDAKAKMAELSPEVQALMRKHNVFNGIFGCLVPLVAWKESPTPEDPNRKVWKVINVMAIRVSSSTMRQDEAVLLGVLNQAAQRLYGPPPAVQQAVTPPTVSN